MKKALLSLFILFTGLCFVSCSDISETKLKGDWVASNVTFLLNGQKDESYYNGLVYSLSFKDNSTVEVITGEYYSDEGWVLDGLWGRTFICSYYVQDGVVHVGGIFNLSEQFLYKGGELVWSEQEKEYYGVEETIVHYKKK